VKKSLSGGEESFGSQIAETSPGRSRKVWDWRQEMCGKAKNYA